MQQNNIMKYVVYGFATLAVLLILSPFFVFFVDEREMAVVLRFGNPKDSYTQPGMYFKMPFTDSVQRIPKYVQFWGDTKKDLLPDLPTRDDKKVEVIPWAVWRISDPKVFVQRLRTMDNAEQRVAQIVRSTIRDVLTQYDLEEIVRSTNRDLQTSEDAPTLSNLPTNLSDELAGKAADSKPKGIQLGRAEILKKIKNEAFKRLTAGGEDAEGGGRGLELIDVGISEIGFVDSVRQKTFDRWVAERQAISSKNVNEGVRLKAEIVNLTKSEVEKIEGEGQQRSSEIRGKADAEVIRKYAQAIQTTGEFYTFVRTLEAYEKSITSDTQLILSTDSPFFKLFEEMSEQTADGK